MMRWNSTCDASVTSATEKMADDQRADESGINVESGLNGSLDLQVALVGLRNLAIIVGFQ